MHWFIASAWMVNGLVCKVLNLVPRHQEIVERILSISNARFVTVLIGFGEIVMMAWIISGIRKRLNVLTQILLIAAMNTLEFFLAPDLLLWGRANAVFALAFIILIYCNEWQFNRKSIVPSPCYPS